MRIAAIADMRSNALALEATLDDIAKYLVDLIVRPARGFTRPIEPGSVDRLRPNHRTTTHATVSVILTGF